MITVFTRRKRLSLPKRKLQVIYKGLLIFFLMIENICRRELVLAINNYLKRMGVALLKSGQAKTWLTWPVKMGLSMAAGVYYEGGRAVWLWQVFIPVAQSHDCGQVAWEWQTEWPGKHHDSVNAVPWMAKQQAWQGKWLTVGSDWQWRSMTMERSVGAAKQYDNFKVVWEQCSWTTPASSMIQGLRSRSGWSSGHWTNISPKRGRFIQPKGVRVGDCSYSLS